MEETEMTLEMVMPFRYNPRIKIHETINKLGFIKIKDFYSERKCQENEETNHQLAENIYKRHP